MNLSSRQHYSEGEKRAFYESAAKRFKAELRLTGATAAIHLENKNDEVFWGKVLKEAYPKGKFRFIAASRSIGGNMTAGCTQCLQYREFLDRRFWIAIDSDYRYLTEERDIDAKHFILQTYTYSFENHFCYPKNCQRAADAEDKDAKAIEKDLVITPSQAMVKQIAEETKPKFSFENFLRNYSRIIYPLLVWQLYLQGAGEDAFPKSVFHRLLAVPVGQHSLKDDGEPVLRLLKDRTKKLLTHLKRTYPDADTTWHEARCHTQGVKRDNCYLYVRGHQLYDLIVAQGHKLNRKFEKELTNGLCFWEYEEITKIKEDILYILQQ